MVGWAMALTTIVAGCDSSAPSDAAIDRAAALAEAHHARLVLVHALADDAPPGLPDNVLAAKLGEVSAAVRAAEAVRLADKLTALQQRGIAAEVASPVGPPGEVLAQIAMTATPSWSSSARTATPGSRASCSAASPRRRCATRRATCWSAAVRATAGSRGRSSRSTSPPRRRGRSAMSRSCSARATSRPSTSSTRGSCRRDCGARRCSARRASRGRRCATRCSRRHRDSSTG